MEYYYQTSERDPETGRFKKTNKIIEGNVERFRRIIINVNLRPVWSKIIIVLSSVFLLGFFLGYVSIRIGVL